MSLQEAISRAVPLVAIPVFADESLNMARAVLAGCGFIIDFSNITIDKQEKNIL